MRLSVICETCGGLEVASCEHDDPRLLEGMLVAAHSWGHTQFHRMRAQVNGVLIGDAGDASFTLRCLNPECRNEPREYKARGPMSLAGVFTIAFHTHHEGHPFELYVDGKKIHPPG